MQEHKIRIYDRPHISKNYAKIVQTQDSRFGTKLDSHDDIIIS